MYLSRIILEFVAFDAIVYLKMEIRGIITDCDLVSTKVAISKPWQAQYDRLLRQMIIVNIVEQIMF